MRIIAGLEDSPRGVYCGAVGYLAPEGSGFPRARFNVPIRTVVVDAETGAAEYGVGGGITWDSRAGSEYDEVVAKAKVLTATSAPIRLCTKRCASSPGLGSDPPRPAHRARLAGSADYFGFAFDEAGSTDPCADDGRAQGPPRSGAREPRPPGERHGGHESAPAGRRRRARRARPRRSCRPRRPHALPQDTLRRRYEEASSRHPDADDVLLTNIRGEVHRVHDQQPRRAPGRRLGHARAWTAGSFPGWGGKSRWQRGWLREGVVRVERPGPGRGHRVGERRSRPTADRADALSCSTSVGLGHSVRWEHEGFHRVLVQWTRTQRAARRFLVHEHGALAVRAAAFAHRGRLSGLVRHRGRRARGERSPPASARLSTTLNQGDGPALNPCSASVTASRRSIPRRTSLGGGHETTRRWTQRGPPDRRASAL